MDVLFVATAVCVGAACLAVYAWWRVRFGRARWDLERRSRAPVGDAHILRANVFRTPGVRPRLPFPFGYLNRRLQQGGISMPVQGVVLAAVVGAVVCWAAATLVVGPGWLPAAAMLGGLWAPVVWVDRLAGRRREGIAAEMERISAALEGALSAGMVPYEAVLEVGVATGGILGPELLRIVADADRVGLSEALTLFGQRLPLPEVQLLVAAMRLNQGAGAGLGPALAGLGRTLRERRETVAAMRAATAAGRWQANMLIAVPPLLLMFLRQVYPDFEAPLFGTGGGELLLCAAGFWLAIGYLVVRRMCIPKEMV